MTNEPNDFDDFATHIHSDELIPDHLDCDEPTDPEYVSWEDGYYGNDDGFYEEFPW
jgi:hypothetical protein